MKSKLEGHRALENENKKLNALLLVKEKELTTAQKLLEDEHNEKLALLQVLGKSTQINHIV